MKISAAITSKYKIHKLTLTSWLSPLIAMVARALNFDVIVASMLPVSCMVICINSAERMLQD